jgi:hypothetical protein
MHKFEHRNLRHNLRQKMSFGLLLSPKSSFVLA